MGKENLGQAKLGIRLREKLKSMRRSNVWGWQGRRAGRYGEYYCCGQNTEKFRKNPHGKVILDKANNNRLKTKSPYADATRSGWVVVYEVRWVMLSGCKPWCSVA